MASIMVTMAPDKASITSKLFGKTRLCHFYAAGCCKKTPNCPFAHGLEELKQLPDLRKTSICKSWRTHGCSLSAELCPFAHGKDDLCRADGFYGRKSAVALPKRSSREVSKDIKFVNSGSSLHTGNDSKKTLFRTSSISDNETADTQSDCSSTSFSNGHLRSLEFKDLTWDPIGFNERSGTLDSSLVKDPFSDQFHAYFAHCETVEQNMQAYKTKTRDTVLNTPPGSEIADVQQEGYPQQPTGFDMAPILVFPLWTPVHVAAETDDLEHILRSAQPECYED
jgi:hypothetical protein